MNDSNSNVIDFLAARPEASARLIMRQLQEQGLSSSDLELIARSVSRAARESVLFDMELDDQISQLLQQLQISRQEFPGVGLSFTLQIPSAPGLMHYFVAEAPLSPGHLAVGASSWDLSDQPGPEASQWMVEKIAQILEDRDVENISLFGLMCLDLFFFSGHAGFEVLNFLHLEQSDYIAGLLYDPARQIHIAIFCHLGSCQAPERTDLSPNRTVTEHV